MVAEVDSDLELDGACALGNGMMVDSPPPHPHHHSSSSVLRREAVARKYASFFQSTMHRNNGYFMQARDKYHNL